jgi:hypothetical protein
MITKPDWEKILDYKNREERLLLIPPLTALHLECLQQLCHAVWDGDLISKQTRSELIELGMVTKWNGWQVITREGLCVLETLKMVPNKNTSRG